MAVVGIDKVELLAGELPQKQLRLVIAWAEIHQEELQTEGLGALAKRSTTIQN